MPTSEILIKSTLDGTMQPSLFYRVKGIEKRPLLVGLHTWSFDRFNQVEQLCPYADKYNFNLLLPEFRGPNLETNPNCTHACGSELAKQDIKEAIDYLLKSENIDSENIFLLGSSGGGHMALLMAGFCPEYFKAIGAYVPITDLSKWAEQNADYRENVRTCCENSTLEMAKRSPMSYVDKIAMANLKIFHGKFDPVVPVSHSLELYAKIMECHPSSRVFLDIFDGGHEIDMNTAMYWILSQYKDSTDNKAMVTG